MLQVNELQDAHRSRSRSNSASYYDGTACYRRLTDLLRNSNRTPSISIVQGLARSKLLAKPDDKVYGLYGIFDSLQFSELPKVDYNRPVHETYTEMAMEVINSKKSLDILYYACVPQLIPDARGVYWDVPKVGEARGSGTFGCWIANSSCGKVVESIE
jgi:hypothetical protein